MAESAVFLQHLKPIIPEVLSTALGLNRFFLPSFFLPRPFVFLRLANLAAVLLWALFWLLLESLLRLDLVYHHGAKRLLTSQQ